MGSTPIYAWDDSRKVLYEANLADQYGDGCIGPVGDSSKSDRYLIIAETFQFIININRSTLEISEFPQIGTGIVAQAHGICQFTQPVVQRACGTPQGPPKF
jgi:hypothetical protein